MQYILHMYKGRSKKHFDTGTCTCIELATGNVKMKRVRFSSANVGVVFSLPRLGSETRRVTVSALFCILKAFPFVIFRMLCLRRKRYSSVRRPGTAY